MVIAVGTSQSSVHEAVHDASNNRSWRFDAIARTLEPGSTELTEPRPLARTAQPQPGQLGDATEQPAFAAPSRPPITSSAFAPWKRSTAFRTFITTRAAKSSGRSLTAVSVIPTAPRILLAQQSETGTTTASSAPIEARSTAGRRSRRPPKPARAAD